MSSPLAPLHFVGQNREGNKEDDIISRYYLTLLHYSWRREYHRVILNKYILRDEGN